MDHSKKQSPNRTHPFVLSTQYGKRHTRTQTQYIFLRGYMFQYFILQNLHDSTTQN